jgi:antitoxin MazE
MTKAILSIKKWGNSLGIRLPIAVASEAHLYLDQQVRIEVENGHVIITAITDAPLTLEQRLEHFDPTRHGGEIMAIKEVLGAEQW